MVKSIEFEQLPEVLNRHLKGQSEDKEIKILKKQLKEKGYFDSEINMLLEGCHFKIKKGKIVFNTYKKVVLVDVLNHIGSSFIGYVTKAGKKTFKCTC